MAKKSLSGTTNKKFRLSASTIKLAESCSWQFWCKKILKLPDLSNDGARRGSVCHSFFELLVEEEKKYRPVYDNLLKYKELSKVPFAEKFVREEMEKEGIVTENDNKGFNNYKLIQDMILVGLNFDFYCEKSDELMGSEPKIEIETDKYLLVGFIDKLSRSKDKLEIWDYKTSAREEDHRVQGITYALWAKRIKNMNSIAKFLNLRFPNNPLCEYVFSDNEINGFERYIEGLSNHLANFSEKDALANLAANKKYPTDKSFSGPLACGFAKYKGQKKKDGNVMWHCDFKFSFDYYVLYDKNNKLIKTSFSEKDLNVDPKKGEYVKKEHYTGCPKFN